MARSSSNSEILLQSGTNELEIITLYLRWHEAGTGKEIKTSYGINAAKVKELVAMPENITEVPDSPPCVPGVFLLRDKTIPLVDLCKWFNYEPDMSPQALEKWVVIVTEINGKAYGFITHGVDKVYRVSWQQIQPPPELIAVSNSLTGVCLVDGQLIQMVDFESITAAIDPTTVIAAKTATIRQVDNNGAPENREVLVADDSRVVLSRIRTTLEEAGYRVKTHADGQAVWEYLESLKAQGMVQRKVLAVVTDIEMPRMDGHHLCMRIKQDEAFAGIPVLLFSSLINKALFHKGESVGADDQITKLDLDQLVAKLQICINKMASRP